MAREPLSGLRDFELVYPEQDVRGHRLRDQAGNVLGTVVEMIVDTEREYVDAIVLDDGSEYAADDFELVGGRPVLRRIAVGTGDPLQGEGGLSSPRTGAMSAAAGGPAQSASTLTLREEQLRIETELVQAGEAVLFKEVVQEEQAIEVPVRHEEIVIEHRPVAPRPASGPIGHNPTIAVSVHEEAVRLEKRPVVTEEVTISTRTAEDVARIAAPLRREEVVVETEGAVRVTGDVESDPPPGGNPR